MLGQPLAVAGSRPISQLSGGERKRLVLETLLVGDAEILLLDEPDNFLDIPAKRWLEQRLRSSPKTILLISHDRELLAAVADSVVTLEGFGAWTHPGSWATYDEARRARNRALGDALRRWKDEERRLFKLYKDLKVRASVSDKNAAKADAAEHRWERFVEIGPPPPPPPERDVKMRLKGADSGRVALRARPAGAVGAHRPVRPRGPLRRPRRRARSERHRQVPPAAADRGAAGRPRRATSASARGSSRASSTRPTRWPSSAAARRMAILRDRDLPDEPAMRALARYGLTDCARREVETMSGGQRARLQVLTLELAGVNLLLLDEPTDNLDLASAEALEVALDGFVGTVLAVTHDRWFMRGLRPLPAARRRLHRRRGPRPRRGAAPRHRRRRLPHQPRPAGQVVRT